MRIMKIGWLVICLLICLVTISCHGATFNDFTRALHQVETSGRTGPIVGDNGKALGPLQIHKSYWKDSGIKGSYSQCADYDYACEVVRRYLRRYCAHALVTSDWETCARTHNGGPRGCVKKETEKYWAKVKKQLTK